MQHHRRSASAACAAVDADKQLKSDAALFSADCAALRRYGKHINKTRRESKVDGNSRTVYTL